MQDSINKGVWHLVTNSVQHRIEGLASLQVMNSLYIPVSVVWELVLSPIHLAITLSLHQDKTPQ